MSGKTRLSAGAIRAISGATSPSASRSARGLRGLVMACSIISTYGRYGGAPLISTQCLITDLRHQPRLANARLTGHQRELAVSDQRVLYESAHAGPLGVTLHERREPRVDRARTGTRCGVVPRHLVQPPQLRETPKPEKAGVQKRVVQLRLGVLAYFVCDQDLPPDRLGHDAGRDVHRLPEQIAIPLGGLACMDANADLDRAPRMGGVVLLQR